MNLHRSNIRRRAPFALIAAIIFSAAAGHCPAADDASAQSSEQLPNGAVTVQVASGRTFVGQIDSQTDAADLLWLRMGDGADRAAPGRSNGTALCRILQGHNEGSFAARSAAESGGSREAFDAKATPTAATRSCTRLDETARTWLVAPRGNRFAASPTAQPTVASLQIDAEVSHWTPTVETSGIALCIHPTSADGTLVPADGTLTVDLIAQRPLSQGIGSSDGLDTIGRWTQTVRFPSDFGHGSGPIIDSTFKPPIPISTMNCSHTPSSMRGSWFLARGRSKRARRWCRYPKPLQLESATDCKRTQARASPQSKKQIVRRQTSGDRL